MRGICATSPAGRSHHVRRRGGSTRATGITASVTATVEVRRDPIPSAGTAWVDASALPGRTYEYVARDVFRDFRGEFESGNSNEASVATPAVGPGEASLPGDPMRLDAAAGSALQVAYGRAPCASDHVVYWRGRGAGSFFLLRPRR